MPHRLETVEAVYARLLEFVNFEKGQSVDFKFDRVRSLLFALGNPEAASPCLHVAGSKGKGSVSTMLARILEASGRKTGLYTSPHLIDFSERISRAGDALGDGFLLSAWDRLGPLVDGKRADEWPGGMEPTFFELATVLGFLAFVEAGMDAAVYEVGMGGRLDTTNVVSPEAIAITAIELEHTEFLGNTIGEIAFEKAGIVKPGVSAFTSATRPEALEVFRRVAAERNAPLRVLDEECSISELRVDRFGTEAVLSFRDRSIFPEPLRVRTPVIGAVQARNAALAAMVARESSFACPTEAVVAGLAAARIRARFEILPSEPAIVLDGAHTPESVALALESFRSIFPEGGVLVFACAHDKRHAQMALSLARGFSEVIVTKPGTFKQSDPSAVEASFRAAGFRTELVADTAEALEEGRRRSVESGKPFLVLGSFYLAAEAAKLFDVP